MRSALWSCLGGLAVAVVLLASGCATYDAELYKMSFDRLEKGAGDHLQAGRYSETVFITRALLEAEPDNAVVRQLQQQALDAAPETSILVNKAMLGSNLSDRTRRSPYPIGWAIGLYPFNRVLDLVDVISLEAGVCIGVGAKVKATDALAVGGQVSAGEVCLGLERRHLSVRATVDDFLEVLPLEARGLVEARAYSGGAYSLTYASAGLKKPSADAYQRARDYWGVGARAEAGILAVNAELHTIELFDALAGFILFDPLRDDIGTTRGIKITPLEQSSMGNLATQARRRK